MTEKNIYLIITEKNTETLCLKELQERFGLQGTPKKGFVEFEGTNEDALRISYYSQTARRVLIKISTGEFEELEDLITKLKKELNENDAWTNFVSENYKVSCERQGAHAFNSVIVEQEVSATIKNVLNTKKIESNADYNTKDLIFYVNLDEENYIFGIDYAGRDLSKRHYMFFNNPNAVKGTTAFNLLMFAGFKPGKVLLDPFALAGVIPIEAAMYEKGISINFYSKEFFFPKKIKDENNEIIKRFDNEISDEKKNNIFSCDSSFPNLAAQKKNSRIAGVEKNINFSRTEVKNLDIKNFSKDIDIVCSRILEPSKKIPEGKVIRAYEDFFSATKEFLKKSGSVNVIVRVPDLIEEIAKKHDFYVSEKIETSQGKQELFLVKLLRK